ncbi:hypothetical protein NPIL_285421, partial [Nephila pilipes]
CKLSYYFSFILGSYVIEYDSSGKAVTYYYQQ